MGCDIHLYVEKRTPSGQWKSVDKWKDCDYDDGRKCVDYEDSFYHDRNYRLFSILADVRNDDKGHPSYLKPICQPKGIPDDASTAVAREYKHWEGDAHSASWHTLEDLLAYDWTQVNELNGIVGGPTFATWDRWSRQQGESPDSWCSMVGGGRTQIISEDELRRLCKEAETRCKDGKLYGSAHQDAMQSAVGHLYASCKWEQPYYKLAGSFLSQTVFRLLRLGDPANVRIVFWFDN
jgi:hypothetical protein